MPRVRHCRTLHPPRRRRRRTCAYREAVPGSVQSVERAAAILRLLAEEDEPIGLGQIAAALGLAKGTAHGIVRTLEDVGFVEQLHAGGPYRVATEVFRLGWTKLDQNELRSKAMNWTDALASRTGESARVAAFHNGRAEVAHHVFRADGGTQVLVTGSVVPLHASALGKVLLAFDPGAARSIAHQSLAALTSRTITDKVDLQRELAAIRDLGWAGSLGEVEPAVAGIAAPIRDGGGYVVATVGIEGSVDRIYDDRSRPRPVLLTQVIKAGRSISRELGHGRDG
jgi:DNA-binding IclR family transcriptional regulator